MAKLEGQTITAQGQLKIDAAKGEGGSKIPRFEMVAYTGDAIMQYFSQHPIVVDLAGMKIPERDIPIRLQHSSAQGVGHADNVQVVNAGGKLSLEAKGSISRDTDAARDVVGSARNGFPWQSSISAEIHSIEEVLEGSVEVNGRTFQAPIMVARKSELTEISFVDLGADDNTRASVAASRAQKEGTEMEKDTKSGSTTSDPSNTPPAATTPAPSKVNAAGDTPSVIDDLESMGKRAAIHADRNRKIKAAAERAITARPELGESIVAAAKQAIDDGIDPSDFSLEMLRLSRDFEGVGGARGDKSVTDKVIEVALCKSGGINEEQLVKSYGQQAVEAAHKHYRGGLGLADALMIAARAGGFNGLSVRSDLEGALRAAFPERGRARIEAGSTVSLPDIFSNVANKFLLQGYNAVERAYDTITKYGTTRDFKRKTSLALTADLTFKRLGKDGEIEHGKPGEEKFGNQVDTFARMLSITRQDLINDDLGALTEIPQMIGRGGALAFVEDFWAVWKNDAAFFTGPHNNLISGSDMPWYLMVKPSVMPSIESAFLNGQQAPVVDSAQADFNNLGIQMRGYFDFGNELQNWRAAVKSKDALDSGSLTTAVLKLMAQTDPEGKPLGLSAGDLLIVVPYLYKYTADQLVSSAEIRNPGAGSAFGTANPHRGQFTVVATQYLPSA